MRGRWVDDQLDGPCDIVLSNGRRPPNLGLSFYQGVLYETPSTEAVVRRERVAKGGRRRTVTATSGGRSDAKPATRPEPAPVRVHLPVVADDVACDLTGHALKTAARCAAAKAAKSVVAEGTVAKCMEDTVSKCTAVTVAKNVGGATQPDAERLTAELAAVDIAIRAHLPRIRDLYHAYSAFLVDRPESRTRELLMTRLGLWQLLIDHGLHVKVSLADFDDALCE